MPGRLYLDDQAAANFSGENILRAWRTPDSGMVCVIAASFSTSRSFASRFHACTRRGLGMWTESIPKSDTPRRMNGATLVGRSIPPASPHAATAPWYDVAAITFASVLEPTLSTPPAHLSFASGRGSPESSARGMISVAPSPFR